MKILDKEELGGSIKSMMGCLLSMQSCISEITMALTWRLAGDAPVSCRILKESGKPRF